uniref:Uncharacterized protein n=1 Tax=Triticum urartu TaxID=4572 RepID=A0A8R7PKX0_TRIUA
MLIFVLIPTTLYIFHQISLIRQQGNTAYLLAAPKLRYQDSPPRHWPPERHVDGRRIHGLIGRDQGEEGFALVTLQEGKEKHVYDRYVILTASTLIRESLDIIARANVSCMLS